MREDNDDMDVITRTEFDEAMKRVVTKDELYAALADTKLEIVDAIKSEWGRASLRNKMDFGEELRKVKQEILSVNKKNIADAIAPLAAGQIVINQRLDSFGEDLKKIRANLEQHTQTLTERLDVTRHG